MINIQKLRTMFNKSFDNCNRLTIQSEEYQFVSHYWNNQNNLIKVPPTNHKLWKHFSLQNNHNNIITKRCPSIGSLIIGKHISKSSLICQLFAVIVYTCFCVDTEHAHSSRWLLLCWWINIDLDTFWPCELRIDWIEKLSSDLIDVITIRKW